MSRRLATLGLDNHACVKAGRLAEHCILHTEFNELLLPIQRHEPRVPALLPCALVVTGNLPAAGNRVDIDLANRAILFERIDNFKIATETGMQTQNFPRANNDALLQLALRYAFLPRQWIRHSLINNDREDQHNNHCNHNGQQALAPTVSWSCVSQCR